MRQAAGGARTGNHDDSPRTPCKRSRKYSLIKVCNSLPMHAGITSDGRERGEIKCWELTAWMGHKISLQAIPLPWTGHHDHGSRNHYHQPRPLSTILTVMKKTADVGEQGRRRQRVIERKKNVSGFFCRVNFSKDFWTFFLLTVCGGQQLCTGFSSSDSH